MAETHSTETGRSENNACHRQSTEMKGAEMGKVSAWQRDTALIAEELRTVKLSVEPKHTVLRAVDLRMGKSVR